MNHERIAVLRALESECYGVCFYMLREEKSAAMAAKTALTEIYRDAEFWTLPVEEREKWACRMALKSALRRGNAVGPHEEDLVGERRRSL